MAYDFESKSNNTYDENGNVFESFDDGKIDFDFEELADTLIEEEKKKEGIVTDPPAEEPTQEVDSKLRAAIKKRDQKIINRKTAIGRKTKGKVIRGIAPAKKRRFRRKVNENKPEGFLARFLDRINDAKIEIAKEKRKMDKEKKLVQTKREKEKDKQIDLILQKRETYFAIGVMMIAFLVFAVLLTFSFGVRPKTTEEMSLLGVHETVENEEADDIKLEAYRAFSAHEYNVRNAPFIMATEAPEDTSEDSTKAPKKTSTPTENPTETPSESTPEGPTETPAPTETPPQEKKKIVIASGEDYYVFSFREDGYSVRKLEVGSYYVTGIEEDCGVDLTIGQSGYDLDYGYLRIQNPYDVPSFSLRDILSTPLLVTKGGTLKSPRIILCYTHTTEGYCLAAEEKIIRTLSSVKGVDETRNILGRGRTVETIIKRAGVGVVNITTKCDDDLSKAYEVSKTAISEAADNNPTCELTIDLHVTAFEYPTGTRYSVVKTANGKNYAPIKVIITVNDDTNPYWRENLKLALLVIERMNKEVPGICLDISLTTDSKYNTTETYYGLTIELGFEGNLVSEADNTAALLGSVLGEIYS